MSEYLTRLAVALPLVLALLGGALVAARRGWLRLPGPGAGQALRVVQVLALGPGARLVLIDADGRRLLLASDRNGIRLLDGAA